MNIPFVSDEARLRATAMEAMGFNNPNGPSVDEARKGILDGTLQKIDESDRYSYVAVCLENLLFAARAENMISVRGLREGAPSPKTGTRD